MTPPPGPTPPNYFVGSEDNNGPYGAPADALTIWKFHYDPMTPGNSTFMLTNTLPTAPFNSILSLCGGGRANEAARWGFERLPSLLEPVQELGIHGSDGRFSAEAGAVASWSE